MAQPLPEQVVAYNTHMDFAMSQIYNANRQRAHSHTQGQGYLEPNFLKSFPDERATVQQVVIWIDSGDKSKYIASDPNWLSYCKIDGYGINKLSLHDMMNSLVQWGLEIGSAQWLVERIVFARGLRAGVKDYLHHELRKEISPQFIADIRTEVQEDIKEEIRREFSQHSMMVMSANIKGHLIDEMREEVKEEIRSQLNDEDAISTMKECIIDELRDSVKNAFDEDIMEQMRQDIKAQVKTEVNEALMFKFRPSILTGMKYEVMEDMKEGLAYDLGGDDESASEYKPEPANTGRGRGRKRRKY